MLRYVYLLYDSQDTLLYIGQTNLLKPRLGQHMRDHDWSGEIAKAKYIEVSGEKRNTVTAIEGVLISKLSPKYNKNGTGYIYLTDEVLELLKDIYRPEFNIDEIAIPFDLKNLNMRE